MTWFFPAGLCPVLIVMAVTALSALESPGIKSERKPDRTHWAEHTDGDGPGPALRNTETLQIFAQISLSQSKCLVVLQGESRTKWIEESFRGLRPSNQDMLDMLF